MAKVNFTRRCYINTFLDAQKHAIRKGFNAGLFITASELALALGITAPKLFVTEQQLTELLDILKDLIRETGYNPDTILAIKIGTLYLVINVGLVYIWKFVQRFREVALECDGFSAFYKKLKGVATYLKQLISSNGKVQ